jgi:hypothetical protein
MGGGNQVIHRSDTKELWRSEKSAQGIGAFQSMLILGVKAIASD